MDTLVQPVILSGGVGTRLWPYSREAYPKQFLSLTGGKTLLQETLHRIDGLHVGSAHLRLLAPMVVCNEAHRFLVAEQLRQLDLEGSQIILEPIGRNTAPALTLAAYLAVEQQQDPVLVVMPSDHMIQDSMRFRQLVIQAVELAQQGAIVTFGIVPAKPETAFGYIRKGKVIEGDAALIDAFVEKPDVETAQSYLDSGDYFWNSGIFILRASIWLREINQYRPDIAEICSESVEKGKNDGDFFRIAKAVFKNCPSDSIDYAVMEKVARHTDDIQAVILPLDAGWSDLGSWPALRDVQEQDTDGNIVLGDVFAKDSSNSVLYSQNRFLAAIGVTDLIVIETTDAVLVAHKDSAQDIKIITEHLKNAQRYEHIFHAKVHRPWGDYESIDKGSRYQVKRLTVKPGASLSLQMHHHRAEHWVVVSGTARVTRGDEIFLLTENQSTYIPLGVRHRLENPGTITLEMIEVQSGSYLGEDDIVRYEDRYDRIES